MNSYLLAALASQRRREVREAYADGSIVGSPILRLAIARALRASGDRLFRLGVMLDARVSAPAGETTIP
jgi:hypothetical protein